MEIYLLAGLKTKKTIKINLFNTHNHFFQNLSINVSQEPTPSHILDAGNT